jgi:hypothetical protein
MGGAKRPDNHTPRRSAQRRRHHSALTSVERGTATDGMVVDQAR